MTDAKKALNKLASELCKEEGGKSQIKIGDMRQLLKILVKREAFYADVLVTLTDAASEYCAELAAKNSRQYQQGLIKGVKASLEKSKKAKAVKKVLKKKAK